MKIKVCGMKYKDNILALGTLLPDYMGFIFYEKSKRYAGSALDVDVLKTIPKSIIKTGVFVNASLEAVLKTVQTFGLEAVQLHGEESTTYCETLRQKTNVTIIKVFSIAKAEDFIPVTSFDHCCDFYLFDTKTELYGGSGKQFDWDLLKSYKGSKPYFLSGGIGPEHTSSIMAIQDDRLYAVDVNSKFEIEPGEKNISDLKQFIETLRG